MSRGRNNQEPPTQTVMMTPEQAAAYYAAQQPQYPQAPYAMPPQYPQPHEVAPRGRRGGLLAGVVLGVGATVLASFVAGRPGFEVSEPGTWIKGTVTEMAPIAFKDCKAAMKTDLKGSRETDLVIFDKGVPGSGFNSTLDGKTDTLFCHQKPELSVVVEGEEQEINIQAKSIELRTRYIEDQTTVVTGNPNLSAMGDGIGQFIKGITLGKADILAKYNDEQKALLASELRQEGINTVDRDCAKEAWPITQQAITAAYKMEAKVQGIDPANVTVNFIGEPTYVGEYEKGPTDISPLFRMAKDQKPFDSKCTVDPDALKIEDTYKTIPKEVGKVVTKAMGTARQLEAVS